MPISLRIIAFGSKWHSDQVFEDRRSRTLDELFEPEAVQIIQIHLKGVQPNTPRNYQDLKLQECWMKVS